MERTFFIVDDDTMQNEIHSILVQKVNPEARVIKFTSGEAALKAIEEGLVPDIVFLDLHIPGESITVFLEGHKSGHCSADIYLMSSAAFLNQPELQIKFPAIKDFISKPLLDYKLRSVLGSFA